MTSFELVWIARVDDLYPAHVGVSADQQVSQRHRLNIFEAAARAIHNIQETLNRKSLKAQITEKHLRFEISNKVSFFVFWKEELQRILGYIYLWRVETCPMLFLNRGVWRGNGLTVSSCRKSLTFRMNLPVRQPAKFSVFIFRKNIYIFTYQKIEIIFTVAPWLSKTSESPSLSSRVWMQPFRRKGVLDDTDIFNLLLSLAISGEHVVESHRWINLNSGQWWTEFLVDFTHEFDLKKLGEPGSDSIVKLNESSAFTNDLRASLAGESEHTRSRNPTDKSLILFTSALSPRVGVLVSFGLLMFITKCNNFCGISKNK